MTERVLVGDEKQTESGRRHVGPDAAWRLLMVVGAMLALVGWADIVLTWYPPRWGSLEWELGTVSSTFDALPLGTLGLAILAAGLIARAWLRTSRALSVLMWLIVVALLGLMLLFVLDVAPALRAVNPALRGALKKSMLKTAFIAVLYLSTYVVMAWWLWRVSRVGSSKGASQ